MMLFVVQRNFEAGAPGTRLIDANIAGVNKDTVGSHLLSGRVAKKHYLCGKAFF